MNKIEMIKSAMTLSAVIGDLPTMPDAIWQKDGYIYCESEVVAYFISDLLGMLMGEQIPVFMKDDYYVVNAYGDIDD